METRSRKGYYVIMDFDDTLVRHGFITKFFFALSQFFHKLAIYFTKPYKPMVDLALKKKGIIVVTGRTYNDKPSVKKRLERMGIKPRAIMSFPRGQMTFVWKASTVLGFMRDKPILHVDDHVEAVWKEIASLMSQLSDSENLALVSHPVSMGLNPLLRKNLLKSSELIRTIEGSSLSTKDDQQK